MSDKGLESFIRQISSDDGLRQALQERFDDLGRIPADELAAFATEHGYAFNVEEAKRELSDADLEQVAGGLTVSGTSTTSMDKSSPLLVYKVDYDLAADTFNFLKFR